MSSELSHFAVGTTDALGVFSNSVSSFSASDQSMSRAFHLAFALERQVTGSDTLFQFRQRELLHLSHLLIRIPIVHQKNL